MGLVIEIPYIEDGRRWLGEWEIWADGEIAPADEYEEQIDLDLAEVELGGGVANRLKFYLRYKELGLGAFEDHETWFEAFTKALEEQGIEAFDEDWDFEDEDVEVETFFKERSVDSEMYEEIVEAKYCILLKGETVTCWNRKVESRVVDPVSFHTETTDYGEDLEFSDYVVPDAVRSFLDYFDLEEPDLEDPEVMHPKSSKDENAPFGVLYKINIEHREDEIVVPYDSEFDATEAKELSDDVIKRDGDESYIQTWHVRRLQPGEKELGKERRADIRYPWGEDDPPEWMDSWIIMTEDERKYG